MMLFQFVVILSYFCHCLGDLLNTYAGLVTASSRGDGADARGATLRQPTGIFRDTLGAIYIAEKNFIRRISPAGIITTVAGSLEDTGQGYAVPATAAYLNGAYGLAGDSNGKIFVSFNNLCVIRSVVVGGLVEALVGDLAGACGIADGDASSAQLNQPLGLFYSNGMLFVADSANFRIRMVNVSTGSVSTLIGSSTNGYTASGAVTSILLDTPNSLWVSTSGAVWFTDGDSCGVRRYDPTSQTVSLIAGISPSSNICGRPANATVAANSMITAQQAVCGDTAGNLYLSLVPVLGQASVYRIAPDGRIFQITANTTDPSKGSGYADGVPTISVGIQDVRACAVDTAGFLYLADYADNSVWKASPSENITAVVGYKHNTLMAATSLSLGRVDSIWANTAGELFVADSTRYVIHKISVTGMISLFVGTGYAGYNGANSSRASLTLMGECHGVVGDAAGALYFTDFNNSLLRKVDTNSIVTTLAGVYNAACSPPHDSPTDLCSPAALAYADGALYFYEAGLHAIRKYSLTTGIVSAFVGDYSTSGGFVNGPGTSAHLGYVRELWINEAANILLLAESNVNVVRQIALTGNTVGQYAGNGAAGFTGQVGLTPVNSGIDQPFGVCGDATGAVYIMSGYRVLTVGSYLSPIIGNGGYAYGGENIHASTASGIGTAGNCVTDSAGMLYFVESVDPAGGSNRIRRVVNSYPTSQPSRQPSSRPTDPPSTDIPATCASGYTLSFPYCYKVLTGQYARADQKAACNAEGGWLVSILTMTQNTFLTTNFGSAASTNGLWIGLNDIAAEGVYVWDHGEATSFANWAPGEPSLTSTTDCVKMNSSGKWYIVTCTDSGLAICQSDMSCGVGYVYNSATGMCSFLAPTSQPSRQPSSQPSNQPSSQPSTQPSRQPTAQPSSQDTARPTTQPSGQPASQPSLQPSAQPTGRPTSQPFRQPSVQPTRQPVLQPTSVPTVQPVGQPSIYPSSQPSARPSVQPSRQPSSQPSAQPSGRPSRQSTAQPSSRPSVQPSCQPSRQPTCMPSRQPSDQPTAQPSMRPSWQPTGRPSVQPSAQPTVSPTDQPSTQPSRQPSAQPTSRPSHQPSADPTTQPSRQPSMQPSRQPSAQPTCSPTSQPTRSPSVQPSSQPSQQPSRQPSMQPSQQPSLKPSGQPSMQPSTQPSARPSRQPSGQPSSQPTGQPSAQPSREPTMQPSNQPSIQPSGHPSVQPSMQPTASPSSQPSSRPSRQPSTQPSSQPSTSPTVQPTEQPSRQPTEQPSAQPSMQPSSSPTRQPSSRPSTQPSRQPSGQPTGSPTVQPSAQPSFQPSTQPSVQPSTQPSMQPSDQPSGIPTVQPSSQPSVQPTEKPSGQPSVQPSRQPSLQPSSQPSGQPSRSPSSQPSEQPTVQPSCVPSGQPSEQPSMVPTMQPSAQPSMQPSGSPSMQPSAQPSGQPTARPSSQPSSVPSGQPTSVPSTQPSGQPTSQPSAVPTGQPTAQPSGVPTGQPSAQPSGVPTGQPTAQPSGMPTGQPSAQPSSIPSGQPTAQPSGQPSAQPSGTPTAQPSAQPSGVPTSQPSAQPSSMPTGQPSSQPSGIPTGQPTIQPTTRPSSQPSALPSRQPSVQPTSHPTVQPTGQPSALPTRRPSAQPSGIPSNQPSMQPSAQPTRQPSEQPTGQPTGIPSMQPSCQPSMIPSSQPTMQPSRIPSSQPSTRPTMQPSVQPSGQPSDSPSCQPSVQPSLQPTVQPTRKPSGQPSAQPSRQPTSRPSTQPSSPPTSVPSTQPSDQPSSAPSAQPSAQPSEQPSISPSAQPSCQPSCQPSSRPSAQPSAQPSSRPSCQPSSRPTVQPSVQPSLQPSRQPTSRPSTQPTSMPSYYVRTFQARLSFLSVYAGVNYASVIQVTLADDLEKLDIRLSVLCQKIASETNTTVLKTITVAPSAFNISSLYASGAVSLAPGTVKLTSGVSALEQGTYMVQVLLSGPFASFYRVTYPQQNDTSLAYVLLTVRQQIAPAAPTLFSSTFSADGSAMGITFTGETNRGKLMDKFTCSALFNFTCAESSSCFWEGDAYVLAYVATSDSCAMPGNRIGLAHGAMIKAKCLTDCSLQNTWPNATTNSTIVIGQPSQLVKPVVVLQINEVLGACATVTLDLSASSGDAGRSWRSYSIAVTAVSGTGVMGDVSALQSFLSSSNFTLFPPTAIANFYFTAGFTYTFEVQLCNFLKSCGSASKAVTIVSSIVPAVTIPGTATVSIKRSEALSLYAKGSVPQCAGSNATALSYRWTIVRTDMNTTVRISSASKDQARFLLPAYSLNISIPYKVTVTASSATANATAFVTVGVVSGKIVGVVDGGGRNVRVGQLLQLNATNSYDENQPIDQRNSRSLRFSWSCFQTAPVLDEGCANLFAGFASSKSLSVLQLQTLSSATASTSAVPVTAQISLIVQDASGSRSSSVSIDVTILPSLAPLVQVTSSTGHVTVINSFQALYLIGTVDVPANASATVTWDVDSANGISWPAVALSSTNISLTASLVSKQSIVYLPLNVPLLPRGSALTFFLRCSLPTSSLTASASISILVNSPPRPGLFIITPSKEVELTYPFSFACTRWLDEDLPLTYQFGFISSSGLQSTLTSRLQSGLTNLVLPAGRPKDDFQLTCFAQVFDALNGNITANYAVQVTEASGDNTDSVQNFITSSLGTADSVDGIKQAAAVSSFLLNRVNCSLAPDCAARNRKECFRTAQTCGPCLSDDYLGDSGDSNGMCSTASLAVSNVPKFCAFNCSQHGSCLYTSLLNGQRLVGCTENDLSCQAICQCDASYGGPACSLTKSEIAGKQVLRESVVSSLLRLVSLEDAYTQTLLALINGIKAASQSPDELSMLAATKVLNLTSYVYAQLLKVDVDSSAAADLLEAIQATMTVAVTDANATSNSSLFESSQAVVEQYTSYVSSKLVPGQQAVSNVQSSFRLHVGNYDVSNGGNLSIALPKKAVESATGVQTGAVMIPLSAGQSSLIVSVVSSTGDGYNNTIDGDSLQGNPLTMSLSSFPCETTACQVEFVLSRQHFSSKNASEIELFNVTCRRGEHSVKYHTCAASGKVVNVTCAGKGQLIQGSCPVVDYPPSCSALTAKGHKLDYGCQLVNVTADNITCSCPLTKTISASAAHAIRPAHSLVIQAENSTVPSGSISISYVSLLSAMASSFTSTVLSADDLSSGTIAKGYRALVTIAVLIFALGMSLYHANRADQEAKDASKVKKRKEVKDTVANRSRAGTLIQSFTKMTFWDANKVPSKRLHVQQEKKSFLVMADEALPSVLSARSYSSLIREQLKHHHRWFGVVYHFSDKFPRVLRVSSLAVNIVIMLFIQSITYNLTSGDDGSCERMTTEDTCLEAKSAFANGASKCYWSVQDTGAVCRYVQPNSSITVVLFVAIFSALLSTPIAMFADYLISKILAAPTVRFQAGESAKGRRFTAIAPAPAAAAVVVATVDSTDLSVIVKTRFAELVDGLKSYLESLEDPEDREEFKSLWALDDAGNFLLPQPALMSRLGLTLPGVKEQSAVSSVIKSDLLDVEQQCKHESGLLRMGRLQMMSQKEQSKRMLFLFTKDLLPGISGQILDSKDTRDNAQVKGVSKTAKMLAWLALSVMLIGMLFYIFLFAVSQDTYRQAAWAQSFAVWLIADIIMVSTIMVMLMHVLLPSLIMKDVSQIKRKLVDSLVSYHQQLAGGQNKKTVAFNAAAFLFVSYRLAQAFPDLKTSQVIAQYATVWPRQSYQHVVDVSQAYSRKFTALTRSASMIVLFFAANLLTVPITVQDIILQTVSTAVTGYTFLVHIQLFQIFPVLVIIPTLFLAVIVHFVVRSHRKHAADSLTSLLAAKQSKGKSKVLNIAAEDAAGTAAANDGDADEEYSDSEEDQDILPPLRAAQPAHQEEHEEQEEYDEGEESSEQSSLRSLPAISSHSQAFSSSVSESSTSCSDTAIAIRAPANLPPIKLHARPVDAAISGGSVSSDLLTSELEDNAVDSSYESDQLHQPAPAARRHAGMAALFSDDEFSDDDEDDEPDWLRTPDSSDVSDKEDPTAKPTGSSSESGDDQAVVVRPTSTVGGGGHVSRRLSMQHGMEIIMAEQARLASRSNR